MNIGKILKILFAFSFCISNQGVCVLSSESDMISNTEKICDLDNKIKTKNEKKKYSIAAHTLSIGSIGAPLVGIFAIGYYFYLRLTDIEFPLIVFLQNGDTDHKVTNDSGESILNLDELYRKLKEENIQLKNAIETMSNKNKVKFLLAVKIGKDSYFLGYFRRISPVGNHWLYEKRFAIVDKNKMVNNDQKETLGGISSLFDSIIDDKGKKIYTYPVENMDKFDKISSLVCQFAPKLEMRATTDNMNSIIYSRPDLY
ncbi:MAG: hypothetical protein FWC41_04965 [Firmicutes bacterium]|nr:hypothetical protein [Bacillota bacterium]